MSTAQAQQWKGSSFSIERKQGKAPGTVILSLIGPFTARDMYGKLTPVELKDMLRAPAAPGEETVTLQILDLTSVTYMDSFGLGMLVTHYASCKNHGLKMVAAGANSRVLELMHLTKMDTIIPLADSVEAAEGA
jgi:anti-anti-sigma factor